MLIAAVVDNHDLHERERTTPLHLLGGAVSVDRTHILDHIFLRHHVDLFHLAPPDSLRPPAQEGRYGDFDSPIPFRWSWWDRMRLA
jgi:hypothetical protein